ncbi:cytochrome c [Agriterribacter sp.]|uniref:c-type cytochrome n=1 Tax=Agriterribacter sp. TaxID=2821509 RepID=UPI002C6D8966|nr:cytochrome c [Agriterribacter sp.]HTN08662.1 cytochrome c [Agriterribacter sp.]
MKKLFVISVIAFTIYACGNPGETKEATNTSGAATESTAGGNPSYDPKRGEGKFENVELPASLDVAMAQSGKQIYEVKCASCHKLSDERLVGPGWKGVSSKHKPEWLMNFITNPDAMIDQDPELQAQLEICLVRMPNQSLSDDDARHLVEFMRQNDGVK